MVLGRRLLQSWSNGREEVKLKFRCTGCGKCCTGSGGRVRVNGSELQQLAKAVDVSVTEFKEKYTRLVEEDVGGRQRTQVVLKQTPDDKQCIFLQGSKCSVYQARPTQCRTFPWWPQHLVSDYDWQLAAVECEGIRVAEGGKDEEEIPVYSFDDVMPETILHDIYRSGENYTYDELQQMLSDLREVEPEFIAQYKAELFEKFSRRVVFSDDEVTVLDSFLSGESKPTRSFVFNDRLNLTQSELALSEMTSDDSEPGFDRSTLALEVHRSLCMPLAWLRKREQQSPPLRVSILGAGACTLPLFLLEHHSPQELGRLDAVEPSSQVNAIAQRFFGVGEALQRDGRLVIHEKMGEDFLAEQEQDAVLDVLMMDVEAGESYAGVRAPPVGMLEPRFLRTAKRMLAPGGIMAVNVITESQEALQSVETKLAHVFPRGLRLPMPANTTFFLFNDENSPLGVSEYTRLIQDSTFQAKHAQTLAILERYKLTTTQPHSS
ncbi:hypothetical protein KRP22_005752 [Phytophthora ramorum]|uniref:eEF1A lysine and N-terminal methyltransferase n=1 Tax=Phytophthora ramorum TaxID=164328 RepID=UPI00309FA8BC|nr:eEF1A lysine and N-terminal methyltransferase [Phytophthora ramorum]KAH7508023.1 eEF1A lysine and N-terminal methyltransferase [Phytophthora ramorum]